MAIEFALGADTKRPWFIGEDKVIEFEILADDGKDDADLTKGVEDASTWVMVWVLAKSDTGTPIITKRTGAGISVNGIYNANRATNTQRVVVQVGHADTAALRVLDAPYRHSLKRILTGGDAVLAFGDAVLQKSAGPGE
jgi:hypothetical protein